MYTTVNKVAQDRYGQNYSYHESPPSALSRYVDARITPQVGIRFFALLIRFSGIHVPIGVFVGVVLHFFIRHFSSPYCCVVGFCLVPILI